jgi:hypothetical protein
VCMCTFGVSLYSSTESQPLSRFIAAPSPQEGPYSAVELR